MSNHKHNHNRRDFLGKLAGLGCASLSLSPMLSTITNLGLLNAAAHANRPIFAPKTDNYKALVCVLLAGGNDSFNMLVPRNTATYNDYADIRTNMAIPKDDLLVINPTNTGDKFGLHPKLPNVQSLFEEGNAAFVANVGALVAPTTVANFENELNLPLGMFSHSDFKGHWQTSVPQDRNALGWGGRLADILKSNNTNQDISMNISLNGINTFQKGATVSQYSIGYRDSGSVTINDAEDNDFYNVLKRETLDNIFDANYQNILAQAYANSVSSSNSKSIQFGAAIDSGSEITTEFPSSSLGKRLEMVARTIASREFLQVSNQTFYVNMGGFDTHADLLEEHELLMEDLDESLAAFFAALVELGVQDEVTTFTISDFGRKLVSNGDGADHAWGGNALVMGGAVNGQQIFGEYPELYLGNPLDVGSGRIIPTTSCDEYFAELALWFGASSSDLYQILPNIGNFWVPNSNSTPLGLMSI